MRYSLLVSATLPKAMISMNRVSCFSWDSLLFTAILNEVTGVPWGVYLSSGSLVRLPTRIILLYIMFLLSGLKIKGHGSSLRVAKREKTMAPSFTTKETIYLCITSRRFCRKLLLANRCCYPDYLLS